MNIRDSIINGGTYNFIREYVIWNWDILSIKKKETMGQIND